MMETQESNKQLQGRVREELERETAIDSNVIGIKASISIGMDSLRRD
jgi:hypothetical protein